MIEAGDWERIRALFQAALGAPAASARASCASRATATKRSAAKSNRCWRRTTGGGFLSGIRAIGAAAHRRTRTDGGSDV